MDVTFLDNLAYFPKTQLQGEILGISNLDQFWDIAIPTNIALSAINFESATSTAPVTASKSNPKITIVPFEPNSTPNLLADSTLEPDSAPNFLAYSTLEPNSAPNLPVNLTSKL